HARAGLGDDAPLAEPLREHRLAERVVELVRAGVEEVLALEVEALARREALAERERRRPARVGRQQVVQLGAEGIVGLRLAPALLELVAGRDQGLGDIAPAVFAECRPAHAFTAPPLSFHCSNLTPTSTVHAPTPPPPPPP